MDGTGGWKGYDISKIFNSEYSASSVLIGSLNSSYRLLGSIKCFCSCAIGQPEREFYGCYRRREYLLVYKVVPENTQTVRGNIPRRKKEAIRKNFFTPVATFEG